MAIAVECAAKGQSCFWGAPTYDQVRIGWNEAKYACRGNAEFKMGTMTAMFKGGGKIIYRSLDDPDNARGHSFLNCFLDETGDIKQDAYYQVILPILADNKNSLFWGIGTPRGRNYFWREFINASNRDDSMSWQIPTKGGEIVDGKLVRKPHQLENTDFSWIETQRLFGSMSESEFRQEVLAEFLEGEGAVFRNIKPCMHAQLEPKLEDHKGHYIVAGVDWAKQQDFTCISIGCVTCHKEIARDRFNKIDYVFQRGRLEQLCKYWSTNHILVELNSIGEPNFEELARAGFPVSGFTTTASSKPPLIENLALTLEAEEWQFQSDRIWTGELEAYERKVSATTGRSTYNAPEGMHDDTVIARALMVWAARNTATVIQNPFDM